MVVVLYLLTGFCLAATTIPRIPSLKWYIRGFDFPLAQICFLTVIAIGLWGYYYYPLTAAWHWVVLGALLLCLIYQVMIIFPYTPLARNQVLSTKQGESSVSFFACNVYMDNRDYQRTLEVVENLKPDVVLLVETNQWWADQVAELKNHYPYKISCPLENTYGMILYSKLELISPELKFLVEEDVPSIHTKVKLNQGATINLHCLHPAPPSPTENESATERDAELLVVAKHIDDVDQPTVVMGDLNDVAWSKTTRLFQKVSGLLDPRIGRGFFNTFHASYPFLRWPLDHVFHSTHFKLLQLRRGPAVGSDHFPIYIELSLEADAHHTQDEPMAEEQDYQEAEERIQMALGDEKTPQLSAG